jgi:hypothetical protein
LPAQLEGGAAFAVPPNMQIIATALSAAKLLRFNFSIPPEYIKLNSQSATSANLSSVAPPLKE